MRVKMKVSTADRDPVGSVVEVSETEGRTLIAGGFATEVSGGEREATNEELRAQIEAAGGSAPASATKAELKALLAEAEASETSSGDNESEEG